MNTRFGGRKRLRVRSVLTEFTLLALILLTLVVWLSQITTHEASQRYGVLQASYWDRLPYQMIPITADGLLTEVGADDWSGDRRRVYENGVGPHYLDFTTEHKIKGGIYLVAEYAAPYVYTIVLLGGGLFLFYRRRIRQPIRILVESAERVADGDLDFRVSIGSYDEFGRIGAAFERMRAELEHSNQQVWQFAEQQKCLNAAFSHDLRTPLTVLKGRIDLLVDFYPSGELEREEIFSSILALRRHVDRLERYVFSMNAIQKLDDLQPEPCIVEMMELTNDLAATAEALRDNRTVEVSSAWPATLLLDSNFVAQVFENLMVNAQRFSHQRIAVSFSQTEDSFRMIVADDGPGFTPEVLLHASEPYYRGSDSSADEHFGLGLYICRLLCEKHGGSLTLANVPSGGAEVIAEFRSLPIKKG